MFGSLLKGVTKIATSPLDIVDIGVDVVTGGDGSKNSRRDSPLSGLINMRDDVADAFEELDD
jgi:hypothetical protein